MAKEGDDTAVCNAVEFVGILAKAMIKKVIGHPPAVADRALAEATVAAEIIFKFAPQVCAVDLFRRG